MLWNGSACWLAALSASGRLGLLQHRVAEAFVAEDALAFYFETFADEQILARLQQKNKLALRRPITFRS